jgi:hypothetical protein
LWITGNILQHIPQVVHSLPHYPAEGTARHQGSCGLYICDQKLQKISETVLPNLTLR